LTETFFSKDVTSANCRWGTRLYFYRVAVCGLLAILMLRPAISLGGGPDTDFFEKKIRPVLAESCYECHSAAAKEIEGKLRLDSAAALKAGGELGSVVTPGAPDKSRLIEAVRYTNPDLQMPPAGRLSPDKIADLATWVKRG
jgi:hypothetical protein